MKTRTPVPVMIVVPCFGYGGLEQVVLHLARGLDRRAFRPSVCSLLEPDAALLDDLRATGAVCHVLDKGAGVNPVLPLRLARLMRREGIRLVNAHDVGATLYAAPAARLAGAGRVVHVEHSQILAKRSRRWVFRTLLRDWTDFSVTVSRDLERHFVERLGIERGRVLTVPNAVDTARFAASPGAREASRAALGIAPGDFVAGSIGRLTEQKGYEHLLRALPAILSARPAARLVVTGEGELRGGLEALARSLGVAERVAFTGIRRDVPELLAAFDVFVLPSLWEGQPITLMEAMAAGKAIVATDVGDNAEMLGVARNAASFGVGMAGRSAAKAVPDAASATGRFATGDRGLVAPAGDPASLAAAIGRLAEDASFARSLGERAAAHARREFDVGAMVKRYEAVFEAVLDGDIGRLRSGPDGRGGER